ncbi:MAG: hypothetical protein H7070_14715 [Saprospiraceae bacterium]|nr:hypothetical protein [Pyrinomonadaceae bacterium]
MTIPWLPFFVLAIYERIKALSVSSKIVTVSPLTTFALAWLIVPLVFFSFSGSKLPGYILPAVPAAMILTAEYIWRFIQKNQFRANLVQCIALATFVTVTAFLVFAVPHFAETDSVKSLIAAGDESGMPDAEVLSLNMISHNAEFYASGRLLRSADGKQKKLFGPYDVLKEIERRDGKPVLVLVPLEYLRQLTEYEHLRTKVLKDNGEVAIAQVFAE